MQTHGRLMFGVVPVLVAAMLWGTTGTLQTMLPDTKDPLVVGAFRLAFGALTLVMITAFQPLARQAYRRLPLGKVIAAGIAIAAYNMLFFAGVLKAGVGVGTAITIGSAPIWVTLIMLIGYGTRPTRIQMIGQALCILGAVLLVAPSGQTDVPVLGIMLALGAGLSYAVYSLFSSAVSSEIPSNTQAAGTFVIAAMVVSPILFWQDISWAITPDALGPLLLLGVVSTGVSYALYTWGLRTVSAATAVTLALAEPLTAWVLAIAVVGERVTFVTATGAAFLFVGIAVVSLAKR